MRAAKSDIIAKLQRDILPLQGFKPIANNTAQVSLGPINEAFPNAVFPTGAVHEFISFGPGNAAATTGFIAALISNLVQNGGIVLWISSSRLVFPPALASFGIEPDKVIFIDLIKNRDCLWAMEEALKCQGLAAAICESPELSFTVSRRFQLAVEQSRVAGFVLRRDPRNLSTTACIARWKISSLHSFPEDGMPGVGFPRWNVELLRVRNGKPGSWQVEWCAGKFAHVPIVTAVEEEQSRKAG